MPVVGIGRKKWADAKGRGRLGWVAKSVSTSGDRWLRASGTHLAKIQQPYVAINDITIDLKIGFVKISVLWVWRNSGQTFDGEDWAWINIAYMLSFPPSASIAFLALIIPLTVMKNAANWMGLFVNGFTLHLRERAELTIIYTVMTAKINIAKVYIFLLPDGLFPIASRKHMMRVPRYR